MTDPDLASGQPNVRTPAGPLVEVKNLTIRFRLRSGLGRRQTGDLVAVDNVTLSIQQGETVGLVGESGSGKTTLGRGILRLVPAEGGDVLYRGTSVFDADPGRLRSMRRNLQIIYQDPYSSLDPRMTVGKIVEEGLRIHQVGHQSQREARVRELFGRVGLNPRHVDLYPSEFSGGQRQRIGIARAIALNPEFIVCDEPVSALDVSIQSQILNLLDDLQDEFHLTFLFISHDLAVVEHISDQVGVMYLARVVEFADRNSLFRDPRHPYTVSLLSAVLSATPHDRRKRLVLHGDVPSPSNPPVGCRFQTRCWLREQLGRPDNCVSDDPALRDLGGGHLVACHWSEEITPDSIRAAAERSSTTADASRARRLAHVSSTPE
jgi:oligopeptide/dipeptide ABC transporter ATP-binding protein